MTVTYRQTQTATVREKENEQYVLFIVCTLWKMMGRARTTDVNHRMQIARRALPTVHTYLALMGCRMA